LLQSTDDFISCLKQFNSNNSHTVVSFDVVPLVTNVPRVATSWKSPGFFCYPGKFLKISGKFPVLHRDRIVKLLSWWALRDITTGWRILQQAQS